MTAPTSTGRSWAYTGALVGAGVSVAANVAHSYVPPTSTGPGWSPHAGAVVGAVFWPVALLVAIEILARVAWPDATRWALVRFGGLGPVAVVAAVVSYRHLSGLLGYYGEDTITATVGPLAVDGLMVMATGALLATSTTGAAMTARRVVSPRTGTTRPVTGADTRTNAAATDTRTPVTGPAATRAAAAMTGDGTVGPARPGEAATAARVAALRGEGLTNKQIAAELGRSERTVRRYASAVSAPVGDQHADESSTGTSGEATTDETSAAMTEVAA